MTLQQTYIAEGFIEDCEELIHRITDKFEKVDWHKFCYFWKEMEFDMLFYGRQTGPEVVEFTEEILQMARLYMITETDSFETQVIGLFIAYSVTLIQPYKNLVALRLVPSDVPVLKKFEAKLREDDRKDVLYILGKMYLLGKTQFHVAVRERAMDMSIRKYFDGSTNVPVCTARRWHGILDSNSIKTLENIAQEEDKYMQIKMQAKLAAEAIFPDINVQVDIFKPEAKNMADSLRKLTTKPEEGEEIKDKDDGDSYVSNLKRTAMKRVVDPMKHLHSVVDRQKKKETKPAAPSQPPRPSPKTYKKRRKISSPKRNEEPVVGVSLPSLDDPPESEINAKSVDFPVPENSPTKPVTNGYHVKGKDEGKSSKKTTKTTVTVTKQPYKGRSPGFSQKRKHSNRRKNKFNKKLKLSNDFNSDVSDTSTEINYTSEDETSEKDNTFEDEIIKNDKGLDLCKENENIKMNTKTVDSETRKDKDKATKKTPAKKLDAKPSESKEKKQDATKKVPSKKINSETCKSKEFTIQSRGVVKHFVEYEVNDSIVIRTEKDAPPLKGIGIEYIDNYTGANTYEEMCEVSDDETNDKDIQNSTENSKATSQNARTIELGDINNDVEVFEVVKDNTSEASSSNTCKPYTRRFSSITERQADVDEAVKRILSNNTKSSIDRRKLKQPSLRSKWKKMGLLSVANFDDDDIN